MGEIVTFQSGTRRRVSTPPPPEGTAQILFFLGVRYVRSKDENEDGPGARRAKSAARPRRRKRV